MDLHSSILFKKTCQIFITMFISISISSKSTTSAQQNCGNGPNISLPFWIPEEQDYYFGSPGFNITCNNNNNPVLNFTNDDYIVKDIFYANDSIRLANTEVYDMTNTCPTPQHDFSINGSPFNYTLPYVYLYFFYDCTTPYEHKTYSIDCASNATLHSFAVFDTETLKERNYSADSCRALVRVPVSTDDVTTLSLTDYTDVLRRGFVLQWGGECSNCKKSGSISDPSPSPKRVPISVSSPQGGPISAPSLQRGSKSNLSLKLGIGIGAALIGILSILSICCICYCNRKSDCLKSRSENDRNVETFIIQYGSLIPKRYRYSDLKKITNSFKDELGRGGCGNVFKGKLPDGRLVAVKVLNSSKGNGQDFINEVASIGRTSHVNVVTLHGFCYEGRKRALVYKYMPNGSLDKFIPYSNNTPLMADQNLGLDKLYEIALGIARGLEYLHRGCNTRILHLDIKPHNILLDEDFCPKISDFGLAKLFSRKESIVSMLEARGTIGYIAPEVFNRNFGGVSHKSDVYSYGMMILEMVGGRKNVDAGVDRSSEIYFPHWIYKHLESDEGFQLEGQVTMEQNGIARKMIIIGLWCIQTNPSQRPSMNRVIEMLEGSMEALTIPPKPYLFSPPRTPPTSSTTLS